MAMHQPRTPLIPSHAAGGRTRRGFLWEAGFGRTDLRPGPEVLTMTTIQEKKTPETDRIEEVLGRHFTQHPPGYPPTAYRYNSASIRVRVVDESFRGKSRSEREKMALPVVRTLPEETQEDVTILLLLAPEDLERSPMNLEFEAPSPSLL
jgi:hypothetical protein